MNELIAAKALYTEKCKFFSNQADPGFKLHEWQLSGQVLCTSASRTFSLSIH